MNFKNLLYFYSSTKTIARNAEAVKAENRKIENVKISAIQKALKAGKLTLEEIADYNDTTVEFVKNIQQKLN